VLTAMLAQNAGTAAGTPTSDVLMGHDRAERSAKVALANPTDVLRTADVFSVAENVE
jgi:hypothetical protein